MDTITILNPMDEEDIDLDEYNESHLLSPASKLIYDQWIMDERDELVISGYFRTCLLTSSHSLLPLDVNSIIASYYTKSKNKRHLMGKILEIERQKETKKYWEERRREKFKRYVKLCVLIIIIVSSIFGPDIAGLIIVSTSDCRTSVIGQNIRLLLIIGCSAHIFICIIGFCLFYMLAALNFCWTEEGTCLRYGMLMAFILIFFTWALVGSWLYSEIDENDPCAEITISIVVIRFVECVLCCCCCCLFMNDEWITYIDQFILYFIQ